MRALLVFAIVYGILLIVPFRPFLGVLLFSWLAYMRPHQIAWVDASTRLSLHVAIVTLVGVAVAVFYGRERLAAWKPQTFLMIALAAWIAVTGYTAVVPEIADEWVTLFAKVILISVLTTGLVRSKARYRALLLVIALSLGFLGFKYGLYGLVHGGVRYYTGPGGFMSKNNPFALALVMAIPLLLAVAKTEKARYLRIIALGMLPLVVAAIFFTFSRGGLLAFGAVAVLLLFYFRQQVLGMILAPVLVLAVFLFIPESFRSDYFERAATIATWEEDGSAMGRIDAWRTGVRIFRANPLFGVGPYNFQTVYQEFGRPGETVRVAHNSVLQLLAENGLLGAAVFVALLCVSLWRLEKLSRGECSEWVRTQARMLQIAMAGFVTGGMFLDMAYFDLYYHLVALGVALEVIAASESEVTERESADKAKAEGSWWRQVSGPESRQAIAARG